MLKNTMKGRKMINKNILKRLEELKEHAENYSEFGVKEGDAEALDYAIRLIKSIEKLKEELK